MKHKFLEFSQLYQISESIQAAKDYMLKRYAIERDMRTSEIGEETKKRILSDPRFMEVKKLVEDSNKPGYAPLFLKFRLEQKASIEQLSELINLIETYKQELKSLPMPINDYGNVIPDESDIRPGFERLSDDLGKIELKRKIKRFYNEFKAYPSLTDRFDKATKQELDELAEISNQLESLPDKKGENEEGVEITMRPWREFTKTIRKYTDTRTYPQYRDVNVAFSDMMKDALGFIETWKMDEDEFLKSLKELGPANGILYAKNGYIVQSARTPEAQRKICSDTGWCIKTDSTFWNYGGGRVQINILNKNLPVTNPYSLIGITVNPDQTIHVCYDRPNHSVTGYRTLESLLKGLKYPSDLTDKVLDSFKIESNIKLALEKYYRQQNLTVPEAIISLIQLNEGFLKGAFQESEWKQISALVSQIIQKERGLRKSDFLKEFKDKGIFSESAMNVFDGVIEGDYTKNDIEQILDKTKSGFDDLRYLLEMFDAGYLSPGDYKDLKYSSENIKKVLENEDKILNLIEKRYVKK